MKKVTKLILLLFTLLLPILTEGETPTTEESPTVEGPPTTTTEGPTQDDQNLQDAKDCSKGCIKCSEKGECLICDFKKNYLLIEGMCAIKQIENCEILNNEKCLACNNNHILTDGACVEVPTELIIQNCLVYEFEGELMMCRKCAINFIVKEGACGEIANVISGCTEYTIDGSYCLKCEGKVPNLDFKSCVEIPKNFQNCSKFSFIQCLGCKDGYIIDRNYYLNSLRDNATDDKYHILSSLYSDQPVLKSLKCRKEQIQNCSVYKSLYICEKCNKYHYLTPESTCVQYPEKRIENCEDYKTNTECKLCFGGYYESNDLCLEVVKIPQCKIYSQFEESRCLECDSAYYLENNICVIREVSKNIVNCKKTFLNLDLCEECNQTYSVNSDYSKCLTAVTSCNIHTPSNNSLVCKECISGHYLDGEECKKGLINGCSTYKGAEECAICKDLYYVNSEKKCIKHELADSISCLKFSSVKQNFCEECLSSRIKFNYSNHCLKADTIISNCVEYSDKNICAVCDSKITYLHENKCVYGTISKCIKYSPNRNKCLNCNIDEINGNGYITTPEEENNKCTLNNPNLYHRCQEVTTDNDKKCLSCVNGFYPKIFNSNEIQYCFPIDYYKFNEGAKTNNCMVYDLVNDSCRFCKSKNNGEYYVIYNGECLDNCPSGFSILSFEMENNKIKNKFLCTENSNFSDSNFITLNNFFCKRYDVNKEDGKLNCAQCSSDAVAVYNFPNQKKKFLRYSYLLTTSIFSLFSTYNRIAPIRSCVSKNISEETNQVGSKVLSSYNLEEGKAPSIENCRFLGYNEETESYYCISCDHGYSGIVAKSNGQKAYLIGKCEIMPECKRDVWINGLGGLDSQLNDEFPNPLDLFVSCHKCGDDTLENPIIPTYGLASQKIVEPVPDIELNRIGNYGIPNTTGSIEIPYKMDVSTHVNQTTCQTPGLIQADSFVENCAIQELDITKSLGKYIDGKIVAASNPICVACRPKYQPTMSALITRGIDKCELIDKCNSSKEFNRCEKCETNFAIEKGSKGQKCIANTINSCLEVDPADSSCLRCIKGNFINVDGKCDVINTYGCRTLGYYKISTTDDESLQYNIEGVGCLKCDDNNILSNIIEPISICVSNPHMYFNHSSHNPIDATTPTISFFIKYCEFFQLNSENHLICNKCKEEYLLQKDNKACYAVKNLPNCFRAQIGGSSCSTCEKKYYFDTNKSICTLGTIQNCLDYSDEHNCYNCEEGYFTTNIYGNKTVCFSDSDLNCIKLDKVKSLQGDLKCLVCKKDYFPIEDNSLGSFPLKQCMKIPVIDKCIKYSKEATILESSLECIECVAEYYVDETIKSCVERSFNVLNCEKLNLNEDNCKTCNKGYYLTPAKTSCKINPSGTPGCITFSDAKTCSECGVDKYLKNEKCLAVPKENFILNCKYYKNALECRGCNKNYYLNKNKCEQSLATNCLTFETNMKCKTCQDHYGLSQSEEIISCIQLVVPNCEKPDENSMGPTFHCKKCSKNYYLTQDKKCLEIENKINFCEYYGKDKKCSSCSVGYILSDKKDKCIALNFLENEKDLNCNIYHHSYGCTSCQQGYFKNSTDLCEECKQNNAWSGCYHCDPNDNSKCLACETGWIHTKNGGCSGGTVVNKNVTETEVVDEGGKDGVVGRVLVFLVFLIPFF